MPDKFKVKIKGHCDTMAKGKRLKVGKVYDLPKKDAKALIAFGKAVPIDGKAPEVDNPEKDLDVTERSDKPEKKK